MKPKSIKTGNKIIDFVINHILVINFFGSTGISLAKYPSNCHDVHGVFNSLNISPPVVLYKTFSNSSKVLKPAAEQGPCVYTTGMNIKVLSKLVFNLKNYNSTLNTFLDELNAIAGLQVAYCTDLLKSPDKLTLKELTGILSGCLTYYKYSYENDRSGNYYNEFIRYLDTYIQHVLKNLDTRFSDTVEICSVIETLTLCNDFFDYSGGDDLITSMVLEVLNRRSRSGFLRYRPDRLKALSLGDHFRVTACLLASVNYIAFDGIKEDILTLFDKIYSSAFYIPHSSFQFDSCNKTRYSPYDLGSVILSFNEAVKHHSLIKKDTLMTDCSFKSMLESIIDSFNNYFSREIRIIHNMYRFIHLKKIKINKLISMNAPIFPKRICLTYPGPVVNWRKKGPVPLADPLFLCYQLLSDEILINDYNNRLKGNLNNMDEEMDSTLKLINFILELGKQL